MNIFTKKDFCIALLFFLAGFFFLPGIVLANNTSELSLKEIEKELEFCENDTQNLLKSSIQIFVNEKSSFKSLIHSTPREKAVPEFIAKAIMEKNLIYLFVDAPTKVTWKITKNAVDMARLIAINDVSVVLERFEQESISQAIDYGMEWLMQEEIRMTAGALEFNYYSEQGKLEKAVFQYIIIYKPINSKQGEAEIRFYSPNYLKPPLPSVFPHELEKNLPPFIAKIQGVARKDQYGIYKWVGAPNIEIIFDQPVPNLGLKPLNWFQRNFSEPIKSWFKDSKKTTEKISTEAEKIKKSSEKVLGDIGEELKGVTDAIGSGFNKLKATFDKHNPFGASLVQTIPVPGDNNSSSQLITRNKTIISAKMDEIEAKFLTMLPENLEINSLEEFLTRINALENGYVPIKNEGLSEIVEKLDDISEEIDILTQKIAEITEARSLSASLQDKIQNVVKNTDEEPKVTLEPEEEKKTENRKLEEKTEGIKEAASCQKEVGISPFQKTILINEIAWMGTKDSSSNEWIELKNLTDQEISLNGWQLLDKAEQIKVIFGEKDIIPAAGFYLLERTDDDSLSALTADLIFTGALSNSKEALYLFDADCRLQDEAIADPNWAGGDNTEKRTMERANDLNWHTYSNNFPKNGVMGSPKENNSAGIISSGGITSSPSLKSSPVENFCSQEKLSTASQSPIIFNEIAWMGTEENYRNEWLELKNTSSENVSLAGWQILDKDEQIKISFTDGDSISAQGFYLLERNEEAIPNIQADKIYSGYLNNENETLRLFDQNCDLIDEIIADVWAAGDNAEKRTMERNSHGWHSYSGSSDTKGTPKQENSEPIKEPSEPVNEDPAKTDQGTEPAKNLDNTPPLVSFSLSPIQNSLYFDLSWSATDIIGTDSPSGIDSFSILYTDSSSDTLQYQNNDGNWENWPKNEILGIAANKTQLSAQGKNEHNYLFQIKAKDNSGNESEWQEANTVIELPLAQNVIISEIQLSNNEFIELYNPTNQDIDISSGYFSYFSKQRDWNDPYRNKKLPAGTIIAANGYYLIGLNGFPDKDGNPDSDWQVYGTKQLNDDSGSIAIFSCDPKQAVTPEKAKNCKIDALGWGETLVKEENSALAAPETKSLSRIKNSAGNYIDTKNDLLDFEIKEIPSPTNSKGEIGNVFSPEATVDLVVIGSNNTATLSWSVPNDQDTPVENFSYSIYYSKDIEIDENNWNDTIISTSTTITIPDLYYNSTYYFAVKTFDGQNYSQISNIVSWEIPLLGGVLPFSGQTVSYDKYDDGFYTSGCRAGYTDNNDGTITDHCTGLIWIKDGMGVGTNNGTTTKWKQAIDFCEDLNFAGYTDWRLPNYSELLSIIDYGTNSAPSINENYFSNTQTDKYWTSSVYKKWVGPHYSYSSYAIDFASGGIHVNDIRRGSYFYYLRPVRGSSNLPTTYFSGTLYDGKGDNQQKGCDLGFKDNGDGTKTSLCTNLMWTDVNFSHYKCTWEQAVNRIENLDFAGYTDWRLPDIKELSLSRGIGSSLHYWSSTPYAFDTSKHWYTDNYVYRGKIGTKNRLDYLGSHRDVHIAAVRNAD